MIKSKELTDKSSCLSRAKSHEFVFTLIERECTPETIRFWCAERIRRGKNKPDDAQITEALAGANYVEARLALDDIEPCVFPIGLTTCGYTRRNHIRYDGSAMAHEFRPCMHERLNEDGICRLCGTDKRGMGQ